MSHSPVSNSGVRSLPPSHNSYFSQSMPTPKDEEVETPFFFIYQVVEDAKKRETIFLFILNPSSHQDQIPFGRFAGIHSQRRPIVFVGRNAAQSHAVDETSRPRRDVGSEIGLGQPRNDLAVVLSVQPYVQGAVRGMLERTPARIFRQN